MLILLAVASVPVIGIAGTSALVGYRNAVAAGPAEARSMLRLAVERQGATVGLLSETLRGIAASGILADAGSDPEACRERLGTLQSIFRDRYADIRVLGADGTLLCGLRAPEATTDAELLGLVREQPAAPAPPRSAAAAPPLVLSQVHPLGAGQPELVLSGAVPVQADGQLRQVIAADVSLSIFTRAEVRQPGNAGLWLVDRSGEPVPLTATPASALPDPVLLQSLLTRPEPGAVESRTRDGQDAAYAVAPLAPGLRLLLGLPTGAVHRHAEEMLLRRIGELGAFLLACLVVIVVGADLAVARPLRLLAGRVRTWRPGAPFATSRDAGESQSGDPDEIRRLERAFNDAATAISANQDELRAALRQRDLLMAEIHHRVKNNLQIVASLLNLQAGRLRDPAAKAEFGTARDRVQALATLHRHLYTNRTFEAIALRPFLEELCQQLFSALGEVPGRRIRLVIEAPELEIVTDQAVSLALLVTEAVTNSIKHAFPDGEDGPGGGTITIAVHTEPTAEEGEDGDDVLLAIRDDGQGMQEPEEGGGGIGMTLIRGFAQHLGGEIERHPGPGQGTELSLRFPLRRRESDMPTGRMMGQPA
jgi:two-component sensor histidine kinase